MVSTNLYTGGLRGRYIYAVANQKYLASCRYPEGYGKSKTCYCIEEAVAFVTNEYELYKGGEYIDNDGKLIKMKCNRKPWIKA
jgi:hypothetical protein